MTREPLTFKERGISKMLKEMNDPMRSFIQ